MNKFFKWMLALVGFMVLLLVVATTVLPMVVDPNNYKEEISSAVLKKTGRELTIGGDISWSVFPTIGLEFSDVTLGNPDGFGKKSMLEIGEAEVSVKFMPLLKRQVEVGQVSLDDVSINLARKADGKTNWDDLGSARTDHGVTPSEPGQGMRTFVVSGVEISNARVTFEDVDKTTELKEFDLTASNIELGRPFSLKGGFSISLPEQQLNGDVAFAGQVQSTADAKRFGVNNLKLSFKGNLGAAGDAVPLDVNVGANADIDLAKDQAVLSDFILGLYDLSISGGLTVAALTSEPEFSGQLKVAEFDPKKFMRDLDMEAPVTASADALTRLRADMNFAGSADSADMRDLTVRFDESTFEGNLKIVNFDYPKLAFDFQIDRLNLDDYAPPGETAGDSAPGTDESDLSVDVFRGFTGGGDFRIEQLIVNGLTATDVSMKMSADGTSVQFSPINAKFYEGMHEGDIRIDASGSRPVLTANHGLTGVQAEGLLTDLAGSAHLEGKGDFSLQVHTDLTNSRTVLEALSGDISMSVLNGAIIGIDVTETIGVVKSVLGKQDEVVGETGQGQKTEFAELTMSGVFKQGVLSSDDLLMQSPLLRSTGEGTFNLPDESVDYVLKPVLLGDLGQSLGDLSGVPIPVKLSGNLYEPDIRVDIVAALAASQKEVITRKADEYIGKLIGGNEETGAEGESDETTDVASSLLKGLLGGKKKSDEKKDNDGSDR